MLAVAVRPVASNGYFVALLLTRVLWRTQVPPFPLPLGQGAVIVCNHRTSVDPFFIQIVVNRYVRWMVAREYCEHPAFGWFLRATHAIPTNRRGNDTAATKLAIRSASHGELIGMFPEGHINHTEEFMLPGRPGAILVALKARVPILPCYIEGAPYAGSVISPFLMTARVQVRFGELLDLSAYYGREQESGRPGQPVPGSDVGDRQAGGAGRFPAPSGRPKMEPGRKANWAQTYRIQFWLSQAFPRRKRPISQN